MKKMEKNKVFLWIYPGIKSEFLRPKSFLKNFIHAIKIPDKKPRKKFASMIYPVSKFKTG
jgi:hypothetical protein